MAEPPERALWKSTTVRWLVWLVFVVAWTRALLMPHPIAPGSAPDFSLPLFYISKFAHVSAYLVFAVLSAWLHAPGRARWLLVLFMSLHAVVTEYLQQFVASRTPSVADVGLDHLGLVLGIALSWKWWRCP